jgi:glycosyltransferase involved in cell wall biosynthesis
MRSPRISIVTISLNQRAFLATAIESVLSQDYGNLEYIVVDPGSTDGSRRVIVGYADRIDHVVFERDGGAAEGLNNGFRHATGDLYGFLNADDVLLPGALKAVAEAARASDASP